VNGCGAGERTQEWFLAHLFPAGDTPCIALPAGC
jgi:hypothetical protein